MKLLFSVPSGYHLRELLLPLKDLLSTHSDITEVICVTPAAAHASQLFNEFPAKFRFVANAETVAGTEELLRSTAPDLVITDTVGHDARDYPILQAAKNIGIKTLTFIASWDNVWKIERLMKSDKPIAIADTFIVWNEMMKEHLLRLPLNISEDRVHIVGAPRLDYFAQKEKIPSKQAIYKYLGFEDISRPLIHFSTTELYSFDYIAEIIFNAVKDGSIHYKPYIYASVHPGGKITNHEGLKKLGATVRYSFGRQDNPITPDFAYKPSTEDIWNLVGVFAHSNLLVNQSSTTAIESLLTDVPVINVAFGKRLDWWKWYRSMVYRDFGEHYADVTKDGATKVVKNPKQLVNAVNDYLKNPSLDHEKRQKTLKRMITTVDGTASKQVLDIIITKAS